MGEYTPYVLVRRQDDGTRKEKINPISSHCEGI